MADYRYNCDHRDSNHFGPSYNQVIDVIFNDESGEEALLIPLSEVKIFCVIDIDTDDDLLTELQLAAISECEKQSNIGFRERSVTAILNNGNGGVYLPYGPVYGDLTSAYDGDTEITDLELSGVKWKQLMTQGEKLTVTYTGGYATLPYKLKLAVLQCIYYLYDERKRRDEAYPPVYLETLQPLSRND